jgi:hypothetical protein
MADQGGHGGSTQMETEIPIVFFNEKKFLSNKKSLKIEKFHQIDLVSTLACLFNTKIPQENDGIAFIDELLLDDKIYELKKFKCLNDNFIQLDRKYKLLQNSEIKHRYTKIRNEYDKRLNKHDDLKSLLFDFKKFLKTLVGHHSESNQNLSQVYWMQVSMIVMAVVSY